MSLLENPETRVFSYRTSKPSVRFYRHVVKMMCDQKFGGISLLAHSAHCYLEKARETGCYRTWLLSCASASQPCHRHIPSEMRLSRNTLCSILYSHKQIWNIHKLRPVHIRVPVSLYQNKHWQMHSCSIRSPLCSQHTELQHVSPIFRQYFRYIPVARLTNWVTSCKIQLSGLAIKTQRSAYAM